MKTSISLFILALFSVVALSACTGDAICAKRNECASDPPGADFLSICKIAYRGNIDALRANDEDACQDLADATLAFDACRAELDCDDFNESDLGGKCSDEADDLNDAFQDAGSECGTLD